MIHKEESDTPLRRVIMNRQRSFIRGFCRALDIGANNKTTLNITTRYNDQEAFLKDWENVGKSITAATRKFERKECKY